MLASAEANIDQVLRLLRAGADADALVVPIEVAQYVRGLVRRGVTLPVLLRSYRLGHAWFWDRWSQALHDRIDSLEDLLAAQEQSSAFMFAYVDRISDILVEDYGSERERMARGAAQLRGDTVRSVLAGEPIDEELAVQRLGYELRRHHVALRVSSSASEVRGLERGGSATTRSSWCARSRWPPPLGPPCWPTRSPLAEPSQRLVARSQRAAELRRLRP
jgi:hypothetical protein